MEVELKIVPGPLTEGFSREAAAQKLESLPGFPENATYEIYEAEGRYYAAVAWPKEAAPFPPSDDSESSGPPSDESGSEESGPPSDDSDSKSDEGEEPSSEGAPKEDGKGEKGEAHLLAQVFDMLTKITDALGLSDPSGMVPGADGGPMGGPPGPPHGAPAPGDSDPSTPGKQGPDGKIHTVHERSLKPGEAPPGTTPVGAPAFASVQVEEGHPWKEAIEAGVKEFEVESPIGDRSISSVAAELKGLAEPYGLVVTDLAPSGEGTQRTASARIVRTR